MRTFAAVLALAALASIGCGPVAARAQASTQRVAGTRFEALAKPVISNLAHGSDEALLQAYQIPDQTVPAGDLTLEVGSAIINPSYVNVPITIDVDGKFVRQVFVGYRVQRYVQTAVATRDLVPGTVIGPDDVKMARVAYNGGRVNSASVLVGRKLLGAVRAGSPVPIEFTQTNQLVHAGMTVVLVVRDGGVSIVAEAVARTSGGLGDDVSVYNPKTNKTLTGTVTGPDRVELTISGDTR
jgi:flagella basal body P-ring formation protein FlgA